MYEIGYAYPTSPIADDCHKPNGCWFVRQSLPNGDCIVFVADSWDDCDEFVDEHDLPLSRWSMPRPA